MHTTPSRLPGPVIATATTKALLARSKVHRDLHNPINRHGAIGEETISDLHRVLAKRKKDNRQWQWKYTNLRKDFTTLKEMFSQLNSDDASMRLTKSIREKRYEYILKMAILPYAEATGLEFDDRTEESVDTVMRPFYENAMMTSDLQSQLRRSDVDAQVFNNELMASRVRRHSLEEQNQFQEAELQKLRQDLNISQRAAEGFKNQPQVLQKEMLDRVPRIQAISDEAFSRDFHTLASMVKSLGRSVQPTPDIDVLHILRSDTLLSDVAEHQWNTRARKKAYVEAWIWSVLINLVFSTPFMFCGELATTLNNGWFWLFGEAYAIHWPHASPECENWRYTTVEKLLDRVGREIITEGQMRVENRRPGEKTRDLQRSVIQTRKNVAMFIVTNLTAISSATDFLHVPNIINQAFTLAVDMSLQQSRLQITWPEVGDKFDAEHMSPVPDRNGEEIRGGVVAFVVNPGLTKWGDANGNHLDRCCDLVPSLVQLEPR